MAKNNEMKRDIASNQVVNMLVYLTMTVWTLILQLYGGELKIYPESYNSFEASPLWSVYHF